MSSVPVGAATRPLTQSSDWSDVPSFALSAPWAAPSDGLQLFSNNLVPGLLFSDITEIDTFDIPFLDAPAADDPVLLPSHSGAAPPASLPNPNPHLNSNPNPTPSPAPAPSLRAAPLSASSLQFDSDSSDMDDDPGHVSDFDDPAPADLDALPLRRGGKRRRVSENELEIPSELAGMASADIKKWLKLNRASLSTEMFKQVSKYMSILRNRETALKSRARKKERLVTLENEKVELQGKIAAVERKVEFLKAENTALRQQLVAFLAVIKSSRSGLLFQRMLAMERGHPQLCSQSTPEVNLTEKCVNALAAFLAIALSNYKMTVAPTLIESATRLKKTMRSMGVLKEEMGEEEVESK